MADQIEQCPYNSRMTQKCVLARGHKGKCVGSEQAAIEADGHTVAQLAKACATIDLLKAALSDIAAFDVGNLRTLEDEVAIWRIATNALKASQSDASADHA